jgi:putative flippase GtrA
VNLLRRSLRFQIVGLIGIVVQLASLAFFAKALHLNESLAVILAVECAVLHNFAWHEQWTWSDRLLPQEEMPRRLLKFHLANGLISIGGNFVLMQLFRTWLGWDLLVANLASIATLFLLNFSAGNWFVFQKTSPEV